jgi:NO-binding membrane sensor protein with MHYT domain
MVLYVEYRAAFISLTVAVSFIGTYGAVAACEQFRIAVCTGSWDARYKQLLLVAVCLGGVCIWGEFYMMLSSFRLHDSAGAVVTKQYDTALCVSSIPIVIVLTYIGLLIASTDSYFTRSKKEILEIYRSDQKNTVAGAPLDMSSFETNFAVSTHKPCRIICGSLFMAVALVVMRTMGFASIYIPGTVRPQNGPIVAQAVVAVVGSVSGFWIYFRLLSLYPSWDVVRTACTLHGVLLFSGIRYVSLSGVRFEYDASIQMPSEEVSISSSDLIGGVILATVMVSFLALVYVLSDLRAWLRKTNTQVRQADRALLALLNRPPAERNLNHTVITPQQGPRHGLYTQSQRYTQAPLEVVNYSRQFLKSVTQRSATQSEVFTFKHRIYYDIDVSQFDVFDSSGVPQAGRLRGISEDNNINMDARRGSMQSIEGMSSPWPLGRRAGDECLVSAEAPPDVRTELRVKPSSIVTRTSEELSVRTLRKVLVSTNEVSEV